MWPKNFELAKQLVEDAIARFGKFELDAAGWLAEEILASRGPGDWDTFIAIVRSGDPISDEEKGAWGHPKWFKVGRKGWDAMTDEGRYQPREAVEELLAHVFWSCRLPHRRAQITELARLEGAPGVPFYPVIRINADDLCCPEARAIAKTNFPNRDFPDLPLPNCSQVWCKCDWSPKTKRDLEKESDA